MGSGAPVPHGASSDPQRCDRARPGTSLGLKGTDVLALFTIAGLLGASACVEFDRQDQVKDLRVLAASTSVAEVFYDASIAFGAPFQTVDVELEVFAYDPRGGEVTTTVQLCAPNVDPEDGVGCLDVGDVTSAIPDDDPAGRAPNTTFTVALDAALLQTFLPAGPDGAPSFSFNTALPTFQIFVENAKAEGVTREEAFKRLPVSLDLRTLPPPIAQQVELVYGVPLCTPEESAVLNPGAAFCVAQREPNRTPTLIGFEIGADEPSDEVLLAESATHGPRAEVEADAGAVIVIDPVLAPDTIELYQVQTLEITNSALGVDNRREQTAVTWTSTDGDVGAATTTLDEEGEGSLGIEWTLPEGKDAGDKDALIVVVYDQRGGVSVGQVDVVYR